MRTLPGGMRDKVLVAAELFAESGLDATKMEDVAAATGVPKATLYYYFSGKEDILAFLFGEILDEVSRAVGAAVHRDGTAADRLRAAVVAHLGVFKEYPAASQALQFDLGRAARIPFITERINAAFIEPVQALLTDGAKDHSIRPVKHPRIVATAILGAITTVGMNGLTMGSPRRVGPLADDLVDFVLHGVAGAPAAGGHR